MNNASIAIQTPPPDSVPLHPIVGCCRVCGTDNVETRNLDLYVNGSEGLNACHDCEMAIVEYVRRLQSIACRARKWGYLAAKQVAAAKAANR
jgi:hypothetical protein